jgi:hypothetical protein
MMKALPSRSAGGFIFEARTVGLSSSGLRVPSFSNGQKVLKTAFNCRPVRRLGTFITTLILLGKVILKLYGFATHLQMYLRLYVKYYLSV